MRQRVSIIGGGPCGLMLASTLDPHKFEVTIYEQNAAPGRKFLVAGDGGLNLTHSEDPKIFIERYTPSAFLQNSFSQFNNTDLRSWFHNLGIKTFVGSSGRVFPDKTIKPVTVLGAILKKLESQQVKILNKYKWCGFGNTGTLLFEINKNLIEVNSEVTVFCMGGASWPVTGSTGEWAQILKAKNIHVRPFAASNCAYNIAWKDSLKKTLAGKPLKNISVTCEQKTHFGEVVITSAGIEGSGIYPLSPQIRKQLNESKTAKVFIDLKPGLTSERLLEKLSAPSKARTYTARIQEQLNLSDTQLVLIKELLDKNSFTDIKVLSACIKALPLHITGTAAVADAISTVGGVSLDQINENYMLRDMPGYYVLGEMLDYDAPTGGYLLQSCFSMGWHLAQILNKL